MSFKSIGFAAISLALLQGCQFSPGLADETISYNEAVANSTNQMLLLNVLRSMERYPNYYSRTTGSTASTTLNPELMIGAPLNFNALSASTQLKFGAPRQNQLALNNLDDQKFIRGIMDPVSYDTIKRYALSGWNNEMLLTLFVGQIEIDKEHLSVIPAAVRIACQNSKSDSYCAKLGESAEGGADKELSPWRECFDRSKLDRLGEVVAFYNDPAAPDTRYPLRPALCFRSFIAAAIVLGIHPDDVDSWKVIYPSVPKRVLTQQNFLAEVARQNLAIELLGPRSPDLAICRKDVNSGFIFSDPGKIALDRAWNSRPNHRASAGMQSYLSEDGQMAPPSGKLGITTAATSCADLAKPKEVQKAAPERKNAAIANDPTLTLIFTIRSLEAITYYLGQVVRADLAEDKHTPAQGEHFTTKIFRRYDNELYPLDLFTVEKRPSFNSAVSISFGGSTYTIPPITAAPPQSKERFTTQRPSHASLEVLTLLNQVWGLQKEASPTPIAPTLTLIQ